MKIARTRAAAAALAATTLLVTAGCGSSDDAAADDGSLRVVYQKYGNFTQMDDQMKAVKEQYEAANAGTTVELVPIEATQNDYITQLALMNRSADTAADVMFEDTFMIKSDVAAGYLAPLDEHLDAWEDWDQFYDSAKEAGVADDGSTYGVSLGTDTRGLWYNKQLLEAAGIALPWAPKTWDDVLEAARAVKASNPDVVPFNMYSGQANGEASSMQGFQMLQSGTPDPLYDTDTSKWITGAEGFTDSLAFVKTVFDEGLAPTPQQASDTNIGNTVSTDWLPNGKLAIDLDGSWVSGNWKDSGTAPWPDWADTMGFAAMPTQDGEAPGATSMSGGWTLAIGASSTQQDEAWDFIATALDKDNSLAYAIAASQIAVRQDVAEDPAYLEADASTAFFTDLVQYTHFRPATPDYAQISGEISVAMESVMTDQATPEEAAATYDEALTKIVGDENVEAAS